MYQQYLKIRLLSALRNIYGISIFHILLVVLLLGLLLIVYMKVSTEFLSPILVILFTYNIHIHRKDKGFIYSVLEKKPIVLYWIEYSLLSLFFAVVSLYKGFYIDIPLIAVIILVAPFVFKTKLKTLKPDNPFFLKGAYEYQLAFRYNFIFLFICYGICSAGIFNNNLNITYIFYMVIGILYSYPLLKSEPLIYTANYTSVKDYLLIKGKQITINSLILYTPVFLISVFIPESILYTVFLLFLIILLSYCSLLLKNVINNNFVKEIFYLLFLVPLFLFSFFIPHCITLFILALVYLLYRANNKLIPLFVHD